MTLIIEDGQGLPDANSYIDELDAVNFLPSFHMEDWRKMKTKEKFDRLILASRFIDTAFRWVGTQKTLEQGLQWPRENVRFQNHGISSDTVPKVIKRASLMALVIISEQGMEVFQLNTGVQIKKEKMAVMEIEFFQQTENKECKSEYDAINNLLKGLYVDRRCNVVSVPVERV